MLLLFILVLLCAKENSKEVALNLDSFQLSSGFFFVPFSEVIFVD